MLKVNKTNGMLLLFLYLRGNGAVEQWHTERL